MSNALGKRPRTRKALGQHFLTDPRLLKQIAALATQTTATKAGATKAGATTIEIGPGPGDLTKALIAQGPARLILIEKDLRFEALLEQIKTDNPEVSISIIIGDFLKLDWSAIPTKDLYIVGNLPYNVASHIMRHLWSHQHQITQMTFTLQLEVALRVIACPNTKEYGRLSVFMQQHFICKKQMTIKPGSFNPPPKVQSAVVTFEQRPNKIAVDEELFQKTVNGAFRQRRKMLKSTLGDVCNNPTKLCELANIPPQARAENLSVDDFARLTNMLAKHPQLQN